MASERSCWCVGRLSWLVRDLDGSQEAPRSVVVVGEHSTKILEKLLPQLAAARAACGLVPTERPLAAVAEWQPAQGESDKQPLHPYR